MTESKLQYTIPEAQSRLYERVDFIIRVGEDEKPCFKSGQHVKRGTFHQMWVRLNTEGNSDLTRRLKDMTTEVTQSLTTYPHLKEITMNKIIEFRNALVRISDTYINDGKPNISDKISGYILTLDMHIPQDIKSKFAIPKMKNPYTSPGIVPPSEQTLLGDVTSAPIDIIPTGSQTANKGSSPYQSPGLVDNLTAAISKLLVSSTSPLFSSPVKNDDVNIHVKSSPPKLSLPSPLSRPVIHGSPKQKSVAPTSSRQSSATTSVEIEEEYQNETFE